MDGIASVSLHIVFYLIEIRSASSVILLPKDLEDSLAYSGGSWLLHLHFLSIYRLLKLVDLG